MTVDQGEINELATQLCAIRGFGFYLDPSEGGQDAYEISIEACREAEALIRAGYRKTEQAHRRIEDAGRIISDLLWHILITENERKILHGYEKRAIRWLKDGSQYLIRPDVWRILVSRFRDPD